ncbi:MAG: pyridoxamine 5'-phosphate oxidase family protein [Spirochaetaceae bacterium]|nr:pyridoxamine 5'-phosphate oxidase family protein [Myxococcales bacterium]MCB9723840.1 pyridoxamine 5'-phosphate oxidase family protein [Spirochaetaceae bacterium]HPG26690.1 pyridoxamine 5'-phosphate oxidase family protein [Myxococcota bacterium]
MNRAQAKFGEPIEIVVKKVESTMNGMVQEFIRRAPFAVIATASGAGDCDASPKGGRPGFVRVVDEGRLVVPDIAGNNLFQSYENLETNPKAGLLFLIPGCDWTVRVNGRVSVVEAKDGRLEGVAPEVFDPDDNTRVLQGMLLEVDEAYAHCPRAFTFSKLWDVAGIEKTRAEDPNRYWLGRWREEMARAGAPPLVVDGE